MLLLEDPDLLAQVVEQAVREEQVVVELEQVVPLELVVVLLAAVRPAVVRVEVALEELAEQVVPLEAALPEQVVELEPVEVVSFTSQELLPEADVKLLL